MRKPQWYADCSVCGQKSGKPCRTLKTKRITDTHVARFDASAAERREAFDQGVFL